MTKLPASASNPWVIFGGFTAFLVSLFILHEFRPFEMIEHSQVFVMAVTAVTIFTLDILITKVHRRSTTGLDFSKSESSLERTITKLVGLLGSIGFVTALYWLFPEYWGSFYEHYWSLLRLIMPVWLVVAIPYFYFVDQKMKNPKDGYWYLGRVILLNFSEVDKKVLWQHLLGWLVKGFFLPLMFTYFYRDLSKFLDFDFSKIVDFKSFFDFTYDFIFTMDVAFVSMGYLMSLKLFDTHMRSTEPTMFGWTVALLCYEPFWSFFGRQYISYSTNYGWGQWLADSPIMYQIWGSCILILFSIYVWASLTFGCRFSNLTHRGILTNGPYRFTKHPAYVSKNIAWWMISIPFLAQEGPLEAFKKCIGLLMLSGIYYLRAKTEEKHLSQDMTYVEYSNWMDLNGLFRKYR